MGMISPGQDNFSESISTLKFAHRTKKIKNKPKINEQLDQETLIKKYQTELKRLRQIMSEKTKGMGQARLIQLVEEKQRAEEDKNQMMQRLQEQSQKFLEEREEKKKMLIQIKHLENQLCMYQKLKKDFKQDENDSKDVNLWLEDQPESLGGEDTTKGKMEWMENQICFLEKEKAHVDQYKDLLFRQRDIMVALTRKLNERDESILQLQEELEAYDKLYLECEDLLKYKNNQLDFLKRKLKAKDIDIKDLLDEFEESESQHGPDFDKDLSKISKQMSAKYNDFSLKEETIQENLNNFVFKETSNGDSLEKLNLNFEQNNYRSGNIFFLSIFLKKL